MYQTNVTTWELVRWTSVLLIGCLLLLGRSAWPADFLVDNSQDITDAEPGDGVCMTVSGVCTLRAAIQEANALTGADTITVPSGTYMLTLSGGDEGPTEDDSRNDLDITDDLMLRGAGAYLTLIDAAQLGDTGSRVLQIAAETNVEIHGLGLLNGVAGLGGGGGGGLANAGTTLLRNCLVSDNSAVLWFFGGGINNTGSLTVIESIIRRNTAVLGGGILNSDGSLLVSDSTIDDNSSPGLHFSTLHTSGRGAGIYSYSSGGTVILNQVTVTGNRVQSIGDVFRPTPIGSGIVNGQGEMRISNSTITDNHVWGATALAPGEIGNRGSLDLNNVTIGDGGLNSADGSVTRLSNTIVTGGCTGTFESLGHNLFGEPSGCSIQGPGVGDLLGVDPMLAGLQRNGGLTETRVPLPGSHAIDAANNDRCEATDQRGVERPLDGDGNGQVVCDIGAYEVDGNEGNVAIVAAVLPSSRSVEIGDIAGAFATTINLTDRPATECSIAALSRVGAGFVYQTTDADNLLIGTPNTPVDIEPNGLQTFAFGLTTTRSFDPIDVRLSFDCTNTNPAQIVPGLNTLLLSASETPVPDMVAMSITTSNDGVLWLSGTAPSAFATATSNVGTQGMITASADTGDATLPIAISICETDPETGACVSPAGATVETTSASGATQAFAVFAQATEGISFDPANHRIFVRFKDDSGTTRGSTSVAVATRH